MPVIDDVVVTPFWCDEHRRPEARAIAGIAIARRVSVVCQVILGSQVQADLLARAEALARLDRGIRAVGGLMNLHTVYSQTGPWAVPPASGNKNGNGGGQ